MNNPSKDPGKVTRYPKYWWIERAYEYYRALMGQQDLFRDLMLENQQLEAEVDKLREQLKIATRGLDLINKGPAKTTAQPWFVWYEEHSRKCLGKLK